MLAISGQLTLSKLSQPSFQSHTRTAVVVCEVSDEIMASRETKRVFNTQVWRSIKPHLHWEFHFHKLMLL